MQLPIQVDNETAHKTMTTTLALALACEHIMMRFILKLILLFGVPLATLDVDLRKVADKVGVVIFGFEA